MAVDVFLNFEKISLQIIEDEISKMTDNNISCNNISCDEGMSFMVDDESFLNNLYHGAIAATFIVNLYETALNTIVCKRLGCSEEEILKTSHNVKLQLVCTMYGVDLKDIKSSNSYSMFQKINKLRNDITHYKVNEICMGHFISSKDKIPKGTSKDALAEMFTKSYMGRCYKGVLDLLNLICEKCDLILNMRCKAIDCSGRDTLREFIVTKETYEEIECYENDDEL